MTTLNNSMTINKDILFNNFDNVIYYLKFVKRNNEHITITE